MNQQSQSTEEIRDAGFKSKAWAVFIAVVLVFIFARFWRLTASCLWFDEIFSVHAARHGWAGMVKFVAADIIHPPLFYALLKVWIALGGESLLWLRTLPVLFSVATIVPLWLLCRELKLKAAETNLALLLMAVSAFQLKYAQILRMYSLLLLLSTLSIWLVLRFLRTERESKRSLLALTAVNLLLVYTHYYGWVLVGIEALVVLYWQRRKFVSFLAPTAVAVLAYIPWIYAVAVSRESGGGIAQNIGWIERPRPGDVAEYFVVFSKPFLFSQSSAERPYEPLTAWLVLALIVIPIILLSWRLFRARETRQPVLWLLAFAFAPVLVAIVFSWILPYPVWGTRHLIICAGPYFIVAAIGILRLRPYWISVIASLVLSCWLVLAGAVAVMRPAPVLTWCSWEKLIQQMPRETNAPTKEVYAFEDLVAYHLWFAAPKSDPALKVSVVKSVRGVTEDPFFLPRGFNDIKVADETQIKGERVWLAFRARRWDESSPPLSVMKSMGYQSGQVLSVTAQGEQSFLVEFGRSK